MENKNTPGQWLDRIGANWTKLAQWAVLFKGCHIPWGENERGIWEAWERKRTLTCCEVKWMLYLDTWIQIVPRLMYVCLFYAHVRGWCVNKQVYCILSLHLLHCVSSWLHHRFQWPTCQNMGWLPQSLTQEFRFLYSLN